MKTHRSSGNNPSASEPQPMVPRASRGGAKRLLMGMCLAGFVLPAFGGDYAVPLPAPVPVQKEKWEFDMALYLWVAGIKGETAGGDSLDVSFSDLVDNLDIALMGTLAARKGKWMIGSDVIYLAVGPEPNIPIGPDEGVLEEINLTSWVVTPVIGYTIAEGDWGRCNLLAGARYLYMKTELVIDGGLLGRQKISDSGDIWNGVIGIQGQFNLCGCWYMPYLADIGTGDSDLTWQAFLGVGYRFNRWDALFGYRHMEWDFSSGAPLNDMRMSGPILGAKFTF